MLGKKKKKDEFEVVEPKVSEEEIKLEEEIKEEKEELRRLEAKGIEDKEVKQEPKEKTIVVKELPMQPIRTVTLDDGTVANLITTEEALTEIINSEED